MFSQLYFFWLPYVLGLAPTDRLERYANQLKDAPRILPPIRPTEPLHLVPDLEHTILLPLSLAAALSTFGAYLALENDRRRCLELTATLVLAMPLALGVLSASGDRSTRGEDIGAMIAAAGILATSLAVGLARQSMVSTRAAAEKED